METKYAFFNVDCHERAKDGPGFICRPRVKPIGKKVDQLHEFAKERDVRIVFTTCCDGLMLKPDEADDILFVPVEAEDQSWIENLNSRRIIYLHKLAWGTPKEDIKHVAWDMFLHNRNATRLIQKLNIPQWIVFGNGMDLCVSSAAKGILRAGYDVTLIEDVMISSANGTPESMEKTIADLCSMGATRKSIDEFFAEMSLSD
jgi:hypothetical protein